MDRDSSEPRVWLPGEGWVVVQPVQDAREAGYTADSDDQTRQESEPAAAPSADADQQAEPEVRDLLVRAFTQGVSQCPHSVKRGKSCPAEFPVVSQIRRSAELCNA